MRDEAIIQGQAVNLNLKKRNVKGVNGSATVLPWRPVRIEMDRPVVLW